MRRLQSEGMPNPDGARFYVQSSKTEAGGGAGAAWRNVHASLLSPARGGRPGLLGQAEPRGPPQPCLLVCRLQQRCACGS